MKLVTVSQMLDIERAADAGGLSYAQMMENAGAGLAALIQENYASSSAPGILALVGKGNNGGDALVALAALAQRGWRTTAYLAEGRPVDDPYLTRLQQAGGRIIPASEDPGADQLKLLLGEHALLL
ncbi:MAG: hypothetical protein OEZ02_09240, partial [Anaerolineae bacterium]|nr:hypothetical protein [Anaerolineae bacterium]